MRQNRFYIPLHLTLDQHYEMPEDVARHMSRVLRLTVDDQVVLFNGDGNEYQVKLTHASKKQVTVFVESCLMVSRESNLDVHLIQALSKADKMETTIQKIVELGVTRVSPVKSERSNVNLSGDRLEKKQRHWQGVLYSACEQTGRNTIPTLSPLDQLKIVLDTEKSVDRLKVVFTPDADQGLSQISTIPQKVTCLIGPEGGLSNVEIAHAMSCGFIKIKAGSRVLRTETAGPAVLSMMQVLWGDLG